MTRKEKAIRILFLLYGIVLLVLLFGRSRQPSVHDYWTQVQNFISLRPFFSIRIFFHILFHNPHPELRLMAFLNIFGNVVLFTPMGFFLPVCFPKLQHFWRTAAVSFGIILLVETTQMLTLLGNFDIDDIMLNFPGACLGYGIFWFFVKRKKKENHK